MARFKYLGEKHTSIPVINPGKMTKIRVPVKTGGRVELDPVPPKTEFVVGQDIGHEITDPLAILCLQGDDRYQQLS